MPKLSLNIKEMSQIKRLALALSLIILLSLPAFSLSSKRNDLYVDDSNHGMEDGSKSHPYSSINEAMDESNSKTDIHVAKGLYRENVEINKGVRIYGEDKDDVVIKAKSSKKLATIYMNDETVINKVTIKKGNMVLQWKKRQRLLLLNVLSKTVKETEFYIK